MRYMVIERFKNGDAGPIYRRFAERGRLMPDGLTYLDSWVTADLTCCYQLVACDDPALLETWITAWQDLVDFEVHPVMTSKEAAATIAPSPA